MGACADGEAASGQETWLGRGPALPFSTTPVSGIECVPVWPHLLIRAPTSSGAGPEVVAHRQWAGARASPHSKRLLVALTSQSGELLGIQVDLTTAPQTNLGCQPGAHETEGMAPRCGACLPRTWRWSPTCQTAGPDTVCV